MRWHTENCWDPTCFVQRLQNWRPHNQRSVGPACRHSFVYLWNRPFGHTLLATAGGEQERGCETESRAKGHSIWLSWKSGESQMVGIQETCQKVFILIIKKYKAHIVYEMRFLLISKIKWNAWIGLSTVQYSPYMWSTQAQFTWGSYMIVYLFTSV